MNAGYKQLFCVLVLDASRTKHDAKPDYLKDNDNCSCFVLFLVVFALCIIDICLINRRVGEY